MTPNKPKILLYDLETFPNIVTSWGLKVDGYLSADNIIEERTIICGSYKWLGEKTVYSTCVHPKSPKDDFQVVADLHRVVSQADAIVAHNGDAFDIRWLNARVVYHGLAPLPPVIQIDTKKIAKSKFKFNSNRLDYLAQYLGIGKKIKTEFDLWKQCMAGDEASLKEMVRYNRHDIVLLEQVYLKLAPYVPARVNARLFTKRPGCPSCGSEAVQARGFSYTVSHEYQRYQCTECGSWFRDRQSEKV